MSPGDHPRVRGKHEPIGLYLDGQVGPPRVRGEHVAARPVVGLTSGPPPCAQEARTAAPSNNRRTRTTPACAGRTEKLQTCQTLQTDHPRVRGEHDGYDPLGKGGTGPPPRARGAPGTGLRPQIHVGTTPACAGSTPARRGSRPGAWDHPRVRGEHVTPELLSAPEPGPPPRARGAHRYGMSRLPTTGTTPACAGSTSRRARARRGGTDHPRVRGEHPGRRRRHPNDPGPPPRARGWSLGSMCRRRLKTGFSGAVDTMVVDRLRVLLPAHAGMVRHPSTRSRSTCAAPRVRGDGPELGRRCFLSGLCSPRTRGWSAARGI